ncbi:MAG: FAD:protein FMN transferase [Clostridiaceae bacterium]|nr:FAD:protein FMN transferase [Clostridiaceae bacterium]
MINNKWKVLILFIILSLFMSACTPKEKDLEEGEPELIRERQSVLGGTIGQIHGYSVSPDEGKNAITKAYQRINTIENTMSVVIEGSDIYKVNANAGKGAVGVTDETLQVIKDGIYYYELTDGVFNIGMGTLIDLWGISIQSSEQSQRVPTPKEIEFAMQHMDLSNLEINGNKVFLKDANMSIDLGGIAKGYAVDEAARVLKDHGIKSGFVNLGGDIYVLGPKPDGSHWKMGIENPLKNSETPSNHVIAGISLINKAIVTSGDYERTLEGTDQHFHHILDPETGYPTKNELTSTTIIANTAISADVLSTAVFVMGLEKGFNFIEELTDVEGIFITKNKEVYITSGIKDEVEILDSSFKVVN